MFLNSHVSSQIPGASAQLQRTDLDWKYRVHGDPVTGPRPHYWPRGRVLGGSSALNYQLFVRGNPEDFDEWERLGCAGWGFKARRFWLPSLKALH